MMKHRVVERLAISKQHVFSELDLCNGYSQEQDQSVSPAHRAATPSSCPSQLGILSLADPMVFWPLTTSRGQFRAQLLLTHRFLKKLFEMSWIALAKQTYRPFRKCHNFSCLLKDLQDSSSPVFRPNMYTSI